MALDPRVILWLYYHPPAAITLVKEWLL